MSKKYKLFYSGPYGQWFRSKFYDPIYDKKFNCAEQYMMYRKAILFEDYDTASQILENTQPKIQKALGRQVKNFKQEVWNIANIEIVRRGNFLKFTQSPKLLKYIIDDIQKGYTDWVKCSPSDKVWEIGLWEGDENCTNPDKWEGENRLGICISMIARDIKDIYLR